MRGKKRCLKVATNVRVNAHEMETARKIALQLKIKLSDYFNSALHDANRDAFYGRKSWAQKLH